MISKLGIYNYGNLQISIILIHNVASFLKMGRGRLFDLIFHMVHKKCGGWGGLLDLDNSLFYNLRESLNM